MGDKHKGRKGETGMQLPEEFASRMGDMLGEESNAFFARYEKERVYGLRVNTAKISPEEFEKLAPFHLKRIPWVKNGFFYDPEDMPTKHPYYFAGLYYMQEPSAMTPASRLPVEPGEKVLDLCAAPGGKATELGSRLKGKGLLVANDISPSRMKALLKNIEITGISNAFLTNESPAHLAKVFPEYFDKILVDAPCSGEGMFRKEPAVMEAWTPDKPLICARMQEEITREAVKMLKPGGLLLYSTCTFSPEENEKQIARMLSENPDLELLEITPWYEGFSHGNPRWADNTSVLEKTVRIWPQHMDGEGHFLALMKKSGERVPDPVPSESKGPDKKTQQILDEFFKDMRSGGEDFSLDIRGEYVYAVPGLTKGIRGLKFVRNGLLLGELKKNRFEPSQPLAMALSKDDYAVTLDFSANDERVLRYLKGETILVDENEWTKPNGWQLVCVDGFPLGWGKLVNGVLKNKYLSGWSIH